MHKIWYLFKGYMQFVGWFVFFVKYYLDLFIYIGYKHNAYVLLHCIFSQIDL